jgi:hypothetical protein
MARNRKPKDRRQARITSSQPRDGQHVIVTRLFANGEVVSYPAYLRMADGGKTVLEPIRSQAIKRIEHFIAAVDTPITGYKNWFHISGLPVLLDRHAQKLRNNWKRIISMCPYADAA